MKLDKLSNLEIGSIFFLPTQSVNTPIELNSYYELRDWNIFKEVATLLSLNTRTSYEVDTNKEDFEVII